MVVNNVVCELSVAAVLPFVCDKRSTVCLDIVIIVTITHRVKPPSTDLIWVPNKNLKKSYKDFPIFSESILWHNAEFLAWEISWSDSKIEILLITVVSWWHCSSMNSMYSSPDITLSNRIHRASKAAVECFCKFREVHHRSFCSKKAFTNQIMSRERFTQWRKKTLKLKFFNLSSKTTKWHLYPTRKNKLNRWDSKWRVSNHLGFL